MKISNFFRLALKSYIQTQPRGTQKKIAEAVNIERSYLNQFLSGRNISENLRDKIADFIGFKYEDMIALGRKLNESGQQQLEGFNSNILKSIRAENNFTKKEFAELLSITESEYTFKEEKLLPFTRNELFIIFKNINQAYPETEKQNFPKVKKIRKQIEKLSENEQKILEKQLIEKRIALKKSFNNIYNQWKNEKITD